MLVATRCVIVANLWRKSEGSDLRHSINEVFVHLGFDVLGCGDDVLDVILDVVLEDGVLGERAVSGVVVESYWRRTGWR